MEISRQHRKEHHGNRGMQCNSEGDSTIHKKKYRPSASSHQDMSGESGVTLIKRRKQHGSDSGDRKSLIMQDCASDYSNMSEPGELEIDATPVTVSKATPARAWDGNEAINSNTSPNTAKAMGSPAKRGKMTTRLKYLLNKVLKDIWKHQFAWPFHKPVDINKHGNSDYLNIIKCPMDLSIIKNRLDTQYYYCSIECIQDFNQMFTNCYTYNKPGKEIILMAQTLEKAFWSQVAVMPGNEHVTKRNVKRKAETTIPIQTLAADPYEPDFENVSKEEKISKLGFSSKTKLSNSAKVTPNEVISSNKCLKNKQTPSGAIITSINAAKKAPAQREINRQIKKPKCDLPKDIKSMEEENIGISVKLTKRSVKRKAETTIPIQTLAADPYEPDFENVIKEEKISKLGFSSKTKLSNSAKLTPNEVVSSNKCLKNKQTPSGAIITSINAAKKAPAQREINRQIKKPKCDLPEDIKSMEEENIRISVKLKQKPSVIEEEAPTSAFGKKRLGLKQSYPNDKKKDVPSSKPRHQLSPASAMMDPYQMLRERALKAEQDDKDKLKVKVKEISNKNAAKIEKKKPSVTEEEAPTSALGKKKLALKQSYPNDKKKDVPYSKPRHRTSTASVMMNPFKMMQERALKAEQDAKEKLKVKEISNKNAAKIETQNGTYNVSAEEEKGVRKEVFRAVEKAKTKARHNQMEEAISVYSLPIEILRMDRKSIELYKQTLTEGKEAVHTIRVMVVGQFDVGKTALTRRLLGKHVNIKTRDSTNGIEVHARRCKVSLKDGEWTVLKQDENSENMFKRLAKLIVQQDLNKPSRGQSEFNADTTEYEAVTSGSSSNTHDVTNDSMQVITTPMNPQVTVESDIREEHSNTETNVPSNEDTSIEHIKGLIQEANNLKDSDSDYADLSIWDFAGQYAFYATHQVFLSWRAVYLLVTDISKPLQDVVVEDTCYLDSSGSKSCSVSEFVEFWLNSIHEYCPNQEPGVPPVILVGTHADKLDQGKNEELSDQYFDKLRKLLMDKVTFSHLVDADFTIDNSIVDPNLTELKDKIIEVASKQQYWGELIPARWITMEKALVELRVEGLKICERKTLLKINQALPVPLSSDKEVDLFLRFHHDSGNILYFGHNDICDNILLDPQWLVDAFKCLITAETFLKKKPEYKQWLEFDSTGKLKQDLIDAVWKKTEFYNHRGHLLTLMEQLDMIARPRSFVTDKMQTKTEDYFFAPCALKHPPPTAIFKPNTSTTSISTSRLCFSMTNKALPVALFNRLMAACLTEWPVSKQGKKDLIFCGCCVFDVDRLHRLTLFFTQEVIQIWITKFAKKEPHPNEDVCLQVRTFIEGTLTKILKQMKAKCDFKTSFKCPNITNVRSEVGMFDLEDFLNSDEVACHCNEQTHVLTSADILKYWNFEEACCKDDISEDKVSTIQSAGKSSELKKTFNDALCQSAHDNLNTQMRSVGALIGPNSIGTAFAVGKKYVMTAWHVVRDIIQDRSGVVDYSKLDPVFINFNEDPNQQCIQPYSVKRDIAFLDEDLDVAVMEIKDPSNLPNSVLLYKDDVTCTDLANISLCGFGQPGSNKKHIEHGCQIIKPNSTKVTKAITHLQAKRNNNQVNRNTRNTMAGYYKAGIDKIGKNTSFVDLGYIGCNDESKWLFSCFMEHGASGSPVLTATMVPGTVYAVGVLTRCLPQFFFEMPKMVQCDFPDEYRFEVGAKMSHVYRSMYQKNRALALELF